MQDATGVSPAAAGAGRPAGILAAGIVAAVAGWLLAGRPPQLQVEEERPRLQAVREPVPADSAVVAAAVPAAEAAPARRLGDAEWPMQLTGVVQRAVAGPAASLALIRTPQGSALHATGDWLGPRHRLTQIGPDQATVEGPDGITTLRLHDGSMADATPPGPAAADAAPAAAVTRVIAAAHKPSRRPPQDGENAAGEAGALQ